MYSADSPIHPAGCPVYTNENVPNLKVVAVGAEISGPDNMEVLFKEEEDVPKNA